MADRASNPSRETIYALSSGRLPAALAIIRISGPDARRTAVALAGRCPEPRIATLRTIRDDEGGALDQGLVLWFPSPASATGEDVVELHLHGSIAVVKAVSAAIERCGVRLAEPGEFTRRALMAGRMDVDAVEGLADLLAAETETQRRAAMLRTSGAIGRRLRGWSERLVALSAGIEAAIDYDGSDEVEISDRALRDVEMLRNDIVQALAIAPAERLRDGIRVAIVGPVNAGKSSLFNALVGHEAAIISDRPGTTRDVLERTVAIGDIPFVLSDTAGRRDTVDPIEQIGIERAAQTEQFADLVLDLEGNTISNRYILVAPKSDILPPRRGALPVSARTGDGMETLLQTLVERASGILPGINDVSLARRHRDALSNVVNYLDLSRSSSDLVLSAELLAMARRCLSSVGERAGLEDMLDALFSRFCLGK